jgi:hypothetical protein
MGPSFPASRMRLSRACRIELRPAMQPSEPCCSERTEISCSVNWPWLPMATVADERTFKCPTVKCVASAGGRKCRDVGKHLGDCLRIGKSSNHPSISYRIRFNPSRKRSSDPAGGRCERSQQAARDLLARHSQIFPCFYNGLRNRAG